MQLSAGVGSTNAGCVLQTVPVIVAWPVTVGGVLSVVHVAVCTNGKLSLPQASMYIQVFVCELVQLVPTVIVPVCG